MRFDDATLLMRGASGISERRLHKHFDPITTIVLKRVNASRYSNVTLPRNIRFAQHLLPFHPKATVMPL